MHFVRVAETILCQKGWMDYSHDEIDSCSVVSEGEYDYFLSLRFGCSAHQSISPNDLLSLKYSHHAHLIDGIADYQLFFKLSLDVLAHIDDNSALSVKVSELLIYNNISVSHNHWSSFSTIFSLDDLTNLPIDLTFSIDDFVQNSSCYDNRCNQSNVFAVVRNVSFTYVPLPGIKTSNYRKINSNLFNGY